MRDDRRFERNDRTILGNGRLNVGLYLQARFHHLFESTQLTPQIAADPADFLRWHAHLAREFHGRDARATRAIQQIWELAG